MQQMAHSGAKHEEKVSDIGSWHSLVREGLQGGDEVVAQLTGDDGGDTSQATGFVLRSATQEQTGIAVAEGGAEILGDGGNSAEVMV